jgi:hypothetical protein
MRQLHFLAVPATLVLLAACSGGDSGASSASSSAEATPPPQPPASSSASAEPVAAPADADALKPLFGTWGLDPANCGEQVLKISAKRFDGPGSGCDIEGFTDNGDGTYTAQMSCTADGQTSDERISMRPIFAPTGEGIDLVYLDRDNLQSEVLRCEGTE